MTIAESKERSSAAQPPTTAFTGISDRTQLNPIFARPGEDSDLPVDRIPDRESLPETAYQIVHDESMLDGNARLNLATFVGTWMDDHAARLYAESADKNMIDKDEYPQTAAIETRCWKILAGLWNAPDPRAGDRHLDHRLVRGVHARRPRAEAPLAAGPPGRGQVDRQAEPGACPAPCRCAGRSSATTGTSRPATCPISDEHKVLDGHDLEKYVDENTIGVVAIMGVTYTGMYEPVAADRRGARPHPGRHRARHPDPRRRRVGRR